jgi:hypothetical protein
VPSTQFYTYEYLRLDWTPYYVGKGSNGRAFSLHHRVKPPKDHSRIRIQCWQDEATAFAYERYLIDFWGRKDNGTGILRNLTDGGEAPPSNKGKPRSAEHCRKISEAKTGGHRPPCSPETRKQMSLANIGKHSMKRTMPPWNKGLTHCKHGHERTPENLGLNHQCKVCCRIRWAERAKKQGNIGRSMTTVRKGLDNRRFNFVPAPTGSTIHHLPQTARGLAESCNRKGVKIWCDVCKSTRRIESCVKVLAEREDSVTYLVRLAECDHQREFSQAISRTPSGRAKLAEERARATEAKKRLESGESEPVDDETAEVQAIHDEMRAEGTLIESGEDSDDEIKELGQGYGGGIESEEQ